MPSAYVAMNELSNHDHSRFLTRTNRKVGRINTVGAEAANVGVNTAVMREAVVMQMTWPGAPTVYYGDEAGLCGFTDPDNRRAYPWGKEDQELIRFHKEMIAIHKEHQELKTGSIKRLKNEKNFLSYGRFDKQGACVILVNNSEETVQKTISVWELGIPMETTLTRIIMTNADTFTTEEKEIKVENGKITVVISKTTAAVLKYVK
jgi:alpha-glucosidase